MYSGRRLIQVYLGFNIKKSKRKLIPRYIERQELFALMTSQERTPTFLFLLSGSEGLGVLSTIMISRVVTAGQKHLRLPVGIHSVGGRVEEIEAELGS